MKFKSYFKRSNGSVGCLVSEATDTIGAIQRTIFDASYGSPFSEKDIVVLRIHDYDTNKVLFAHNATVLQTNFN